MKVGSLFVNADDRVGVILYLIEPIVSAFDNEPIEFIVGMGYFFDSKEEAIVYERDIQLIGDTNGAYILE